MHFGHALIRILHSACGVLSRADMILMKSHLISVLPPDGICGPGRRNGPWVHLPQQPGRMRFQLINQSENISRKTTRISHSMHDCFLFVFYTGEFNLEMLRFPLAFDNREEPRR